MTSRDLLLSILGATKETAEESGAPAVVPSFASQSLAFVQLFGPGKALAFAGVTPSGQTLAFAQVVGLGQAFAFAQAALLGQGQPFFYSNNSSSRQGAARARGKRTPTAR